MEMLCLVQLQLVRSDGSGWIFILLDSQLVDVWSPADSAKRGEKLGPSTNVYLTDDATVCWPRGCCHTLCSTQPINSIFPQRTAFQLS